MYKSIIIFLIFLSSIVTAQTVNLHNLTDTWNASGTVFNSIKMDITDTASAAGSSALWLGFSGTEVFRVDKDGTIYASAIAMSTISSVSTLTNKTITFGSNTITGTMAQFDTALTDGNFAYSGGAFHDGFSDFVANEHIDHTAVTLTAGTGLDGGGDISANRTFDIDATVATLTGTQILSNKTIDAASNTLTLFAGGANNQLLTDDGSGGLVSESGLVFDGINLGIGTSPDHTLDIVGEIELTHVAEAADEHGLELDIDAAGFGDIKALEIEYDTGIIETGEDEAIILININEIDATGGQVFGLEVLSTEGSATITAMKAGAVVAPILQDSGSFANPTLTTNNTVSTDVPDMGDGNSGTTTVVFAADNDFIIIGANNAFTEIELVVTSGFGNPGIKPVFAYSISGTNQFTNFTPIDGTDGFKNAGAFIVAWDAADLAGHVADDVTGKFDIRVTRTANPSGSVTLGYAKSAATVVYSWDKDGDVVVNSVDANLYSISSDTEGSVARLTRRTTHETHTLTLGATSDTTTISIPSGARLLAVSFNVNATVVDSAGDDTWSAAFITGSTTGLAAGISPVLNTKHDLMLPDEISTGICEIQFTPQGGNFSAGVIEVVAYYESLTSLANL